MNPAPSPPKWPQKILIFLCREEIVEDILGDLNELFSERISRQRPMLARMAYLRDVLVLLRPALLKRFTLFPTQFFVLTMIFHYLKVAWRNARKNYVYTLINILGLAIGLASCMLILMYVQDELSYDQYHRKAERIYRVTEDILHDGVGERSSSMPFPTAEALRTDYPNHIEQVVRFFNFQAPTLALAYEEKERAFNEKRIFFADSTVFKVFDFPLVQGDPATALSQPNSILLTESMAKKYFGAEDPIGKRLRFQDEVDVRVTGILADAKSNSHFLYDFFISFSTLKHFYDGDYPRTWYWNPCWTYVLLKSPESAPELLGYFPEFVQKYFPDFVRNDITMKLQPLTEIHLTSHLDYEITANASEANVYIFSGIALFILLIACINFINLSTARAVNRAREVGMRKTFGSHRGQLMLQFLSESMLMTAISIVIAFVLVSGLLPVFNGLAEKQIVLLELLQFEHLMLLMGLLLLVGIGAGMYPAWVLTAFDPVKVLKGNQSLGSAPSGRGTLRKLLVVLQFAISIMLIIGTGVSIDQLSFMQRDDPGFQREHIVMLPVLRSSMGKTYEAYKSRILTHPEIYSATALEEILGAKYQGGHYRFKGWEEARLLPRLMMRHDFVETFDLEVLSGRTYDESYVSDDTAALVVNEALVKYVGWESNEAAIGQPVAGGGLARKARVIGVVKDFNFASKHNPIGPLALSLNTHPGAFNLFIKYMAVSISPAQAPEALTILRENWKEMVPDKPFEYFFLDQSLNQLYESEQKLSQVAIVFSVLGILVACLGLLGLAAYTAEQRKKEIGVRKVLGSSVSQIIMLLSSDFTRLVLIASVIALPLSWYLMQLWLQDFAYRVELGIEIFIGAAVLALLIAWITISFQAVKAAIANPIESLRDE